MPWFTPAWCARPRASSWAALGLAGNLHAGRGPQPARRPRNSRRNAGAALAVVAGIFFFGAASISSYLWFAFVGQCRAAAVVVYTSRSLGRSGATPVKLALAGAAISAGMGSLMSAMLVSSQDSLELFRSWQVGALAGKSWEVDAARAAVSVLSGA